MRAADVCPPAGILDWVRGHIAVNYGEIPATPPPADWPSFWQSLAGFGGYVHHCFDRLDAVAGAPVTAELGWRSRLQDLRSHLAAVTSGQDAATARAVERMVAERGIRLG
jgi:hypothetical protein